jgi:hypothetical protein
MIVKKRREEKEGEPRYTQLCCAKFMSIDNQQYGRRLHKRKGKFCNILYGCISFITSLKMRLLEPAVAFFASYKKTFEKLGGIQWKDINGDKDRMMKFGSEHGLLDVTPKVNF